MYVRMYVYLYVFLFVCSYVCMHPCMHACMYVCMYLCMYAMSHVCMYVCMCVCTVCTVCTLQFHSLTPTYFINVGAFIQNPRRVSNIIIHELENAVVVQQGPCAQGKPQRTGTMVHIELYAYVTHIAH